MRYFAHITVQVDARTQKALERAIHEVLKANPVVPQQRDIGYATLHAPTIRRFAEKNLYTLKEYQPKAKK